MSIPELQLKTWSHQGSITQSRTTYAAIKRSLEAADAKYSNKDFQVFLQGSYGNDTNIYAESDVDVVIRLDSIYYYDVAALTAPDLAAFNAESIPGTYPYADYKAHVVAALQKSFGGAVKPDKKAIKIKAEGNRRSADVVVATEFRRYYSSPFGPKCEVGICFFNSSGDWIINYPRQHSENCTKKHQATQEWFKPMVRVLKNMRSKLIGDEMIADGVASSYYLEGLLYNVPDHMFTSSYGDCFVNCINWIQEADRSRFVCANEQYYLLREDSPVTWRASKCDEFIAAAVELWNQW